MKLKEEFNIVGFFYLLSGIYWVSIGFMGAYWVLYFTNIGMSLSTIAMLFLMYPVSSMIFEIPTGVIADVFGRKFSVFLSYLITGFGFIGILLSGTNLTLLLLFYFIIGISFTLETGALESWFIDTVKHKKKSKHLNRLFGRWGSASSIGFVIGPFIGGILVTFGVDKAFWATALIMLFLSFYVLVFGKEEYFKRKKTKIRKTFSETFRTGKEGFTHAFKHPIILMLIIIMFLVSFATTISYISYQPYVIQAGLPPQSLGFALSIASFILIFGLNYSHKIVNFLGGKRKSLMVFSILFGLAILAVGLVKYLPLLFLSMIAYTSFGEFAGDESPAFRELFNKFVPSKIRATVNSVKSFVMEIGQTLGLIVFGLVSEYLSLQTGIVVAGVLIILTSGMYMGIKKK